VWNLSGAYSLVIEDVDNPGAYFNSGYLYLDFYNIFISNSLEY